MTFPIAVDIVPVRPSGTRVLEGVRGRMDEALNSMSKNGTESAVCFAVYIKIECVICSKTQYIRSFVSSKPCKSKKKNNFAHYRYKTEETLINATSSVDHCASSLSHILVCNRYRLPPIWKVEFTSISTIFHLPSG